MANSHDVMDLTLHGGGRGFESPRLHYRNVAVVIELPRIGSLLFAFANSPSYQIGAPTAY